jgi:hypothetical protein
VKRLMFFLNIQSNNRKKMVSNWLTVCFMYWCYHIFLFPLMIVSFCTAESRCSGSRA